MKLPIIFLITFSTIISSGCASYQTIGGFTDRNGVMQGTVSANLMTGSATMTVNEVTGNLQCSGDSKTTRVNLRLDCRGQEGLATLSCNDGRNMKAKWVAHSCTTGIGKGADSLGNQFEFIYGFDDEGAATFLRKIINERSPGITQENLLNEIKSAKLHLKQQQKVDSQYSEAISDALAIGLILFTAYHASKADSASTSNYLIPELSTSPKNAGQNCASDFGCGYGYKCIKAPLKNLGVCMKPVDEFGRREIVRPNPDSRHPNLNLEGECSYDTDCPIGFRCDRTYKACMKR